MRLAPTWVAEQQPVRRSAATRDGGRYSRVVKLVLAATGVSFLLGLVSGVFPVEVLLMLALFVVLAGAAITGSTSRNRVAAMRRAVFLNDSLIGYIESVSDDEGDSDRSLWD